MIEIENELLDDTYYVREDGHIIAEFKSMKEAEDFLLLRENNND